MPRMTTETKTTDDLAKLCEEAGWSVTSGSVAHIARNPRGESVSIPVGGDSAAYDRVYDKLKLHGLETDLKEKQAAEPKTNQAPSMAFSSPAIPDTAVSLRREIPPDLIGVAGLLSLDDDFDLSQIITRPEDRPKPGRAQVTVYEVITPERAQELLDREVGQLDDGTMLIQRSISPTEVKTHVGTLQRDLLEQKKKAEHRAFHPEWIVAEDMKLSPEEPVNTGGVIDGQHRLKAIIESGIPAIVRVTYNTPPRVFLGLGKARKRTDGDIFKMLGRAQSTHTISAAKSLYAERAFRNDPTGPYANWRSWSRLRATTIQIESFLRDPWPNGLWDEQAGESMLLPQVTPGATMMSHIRSVPAAGIVFRVLVLSAWKDVNLKLGQDKLDEFCRLLHDGSGPGYEEGNPVRTLREWLTLGTGKTPPGNNNYKREWQLNGMLRAWDYFAHGRDLGKIIVSLTADMPIAWAPGRPSLTDTNQPKNKR